MTRYKNILASLMVGLALASNAFSQAYPTSSPVYIPSAILASTTFTAAGAYTYQVNGQGTVLFRFAGTNTGFSAVVQATEARAGTPVWSNVGVVDVATGASYATIVKNGLYRLNASGPAQLKVVLSSITGTNVIISANGSSAPQAVNTFPTVRKTFGASVNVSPAATATDFLTVAGSATATVRVLGATCSGISTPGANIRLDAVKRSTLSTGGTSAAATAVAFDSNNTPGASATVMSFTVNPTGLGTAVGNLRSVHLPAFTTASAIPVSMSFGLGQGEQPVTLNSATDQFSLSLAGQGLPAGLQLQCSVVWTE